MDEDKKIDFFDKLRETFAVEDFRGHLLAWLEKADDEETQIAANQFMEHVYLIATDYLRNNIQRTEDNPTDFFDELRETFDVEEFTGNFGFLLDDDADDNDETRKEACNFVEKLYLIAENYL